MILIDGDIVAYRVGWACNEETEEVALRNLHSFTATTFGLIADELEDYQIYLTGKTNFRNDYAVTAPYKGNRKKRDKPVHLQTLRDALINEWDAVVSVGEEADDAIATAATEIQSVQTPVSVRAVMASIDKDFFQIPGIHYNFVKNTMKLVTPPEAIDNFYTQILTGDGVDNIIGIKGIGDVKGRRILKDCEPTTTFLARERAYFYACADAYMRLQELQWEDAEKRVIENARLLWLRREEGQIWCSPEEREESYFE